MCIYYVYILNKYDCIFLRLTTPLYTTLQFLKKEGGITSPWQQHHQQEPEAKASSGELDNVCNWIHSQTEITVSQAFQGSLTELELNSEVEW